MRLRLPMLARSWLGLSLLLGATVFASACGDNPSALQPAQLTAGMPRCEESLLHPRISVSSSAHLPGKLIVYVDGIMACVDDAAKVDLIISRIEARTADKDKVAAAH